MKILVSVLLLLLVASQPAGAEPPKEEGVYSFSLPDIDGKVVSLADFKGKTLLIVNTASRCGFTPQYKGLEELYQRYKDRGLVVLAFPSNDFMGQEPGSDAEIKNFCALNFKTTFPLFAKSNVKGSGINPLFRYLTEDAPFKGPVSWNFNKFLVDSQGRVVARFASPVDPLDPKLIAAVEQALGK